MKTRSNLIKSGIISNTALLFIAFVLFVVVAVVVGAIFINSKEKDVDTQALDQPLLETEVTVNEQVKKDVSESKEFAGKVQGIQIPKEGDVIFLQVEASIIDSTAIASTDFSKGTADIKTVKKTFNVAVDEGTRLNIPEKTDIRLGDFVIVESPTSIEKIDKFTAIRVEVQL